MEYKFFSEYAGAAEAGQPLVAREDELLWMVDSEADGLSIAEMVLAKEYKTRGVKLISVKLKRRENNPLGWETVRTFPAHSRRGETGLDLRS